VNFRSVNSKTIFPYRDHAVAGQERAGRFASEERLLFVGDRYANPSIDAAPKMALEMLNTICHASAMDGGPVHGSLLPCHAIPRPYDHCR
jgi:hypothetical protein